MSKQKQTFSIKKRLQSFKFAFAGLRTLWQEEHNVRIHVVAMLLAIILGFLLRISIIEWSVLTLTIGFVVSAEILNSSLENLADAITEKPNEKIKKAKDLGATAVLIAALISLVVGLIIFAPKIIELFL